MSTETQRAEFELSMQELYPEWRFRRSSNGHYDNDETEVAFEAWQAAQASQAAELAALRERLEFAHAVLKEEQEHGIAEGDKLLQQGKELAALKAKLASYEANGVTCQTYGHVVGACAECNTHEESPEALKADIAEYVHIASEQATEIEALETAAISVIASLYLAHEDCGAELGGKVAAQRMLAAAMQTKEAS